MSRTDGITRDLAQSVLDSMDAADWTNCPVAYRRLLLETGAKRRGKRAQTTLGDQQDDQGGDGFPADAERVRIVRKATASRPVRCAVLLLLSGVPLRSAARTAGLSHEGLRKAAHRVLGCAVAFALAVDARGRLVDRLHRQRIAAGGRVIVAT